MKNIILITIVSFFCFSFDYANSEESRADEEIEYYISITSRDVSKELAKKRKDILEKILENPERYMPSLKKAVNADIFISKVDKRAFYGKLGLISKINNQDARNHIKKLYIDIQQYGKEVRDRGDVDHDLGGKGGWLEEYKRTEGLRTIILQNNIYCAKDSSLWDLAFEDIRSLFKEPMCLNNPFSEPLLVYLDSVAGEINPNEREEKYWELKKWYDKQIPAIKGEVRVHVESALGQLSSKEITHDAGSAQNNNLYLIIGLLLGGLLAVGVILYIVTRKSKTK